MNLACEANAEERSILACSSQYGSSIACAIQLPVHMAQAIRVAMIRNLAGSISVVSVVTSTRDMLS